VKGRLFWLLIGSGLAFYLLRRLGVVRSSASDLATQAARQVGVAAGEGVSARAGNAVAAARNFGAEVRAHASEREAELRAAVAPADDEERPPIRTL